MHCPLRRPSRPHGPHLAGRTFLAFAGTGLFALLVLPGSPRAWNALGGTLDLGQRDVRVFNNFSGGLANDNQQPDPSFPGATGAVLAIWKGVAEWGSERHGDGHGDPSQAGDLGSGGANFDSTWQGLAPNIGRTNGNIVSEIAGSSLGVLAYTETPIADGWRIRFYRDAAIWEDGPDVFPSIVDHKDIQGVMCHEYGHALGLAHSGTNSIWTMFPSSTGTNVNKRSIESDDIDGVRGLYGPKSPTKPRIDTYELSAGVVTMHGANFHATDNTLWFTDGSALADGSPLFVTQIPSSSNGTRLSVAIPANALPGDVLVRVPGTSGAALSNAFPFDSAQTPCVAPLLYGAAKTTSQGTLPELYAQGRASLLVNDFAIGTGGGLANASGLLLSSPSQGNRPFAGGTILLAPPIRREAQFAFDFLGSVHLPIAVTAPMVGQTRCYQIYFQDAGDAWGVGLSDAVRVTFCP